MAESKGVPRPGDVIADKYRVEREIGSGGMGTVYEVTHLVTERRFAIKWLDPALATSPDATHRFVREAQIAGSFDHPNVVEVYDLGILDGAYFMLMELLEGESLAAKLEREGRLPVGEAFDIMVPCLKAVAAAHVAGIIHRDLKPANIFLCRATSHAPFAVKVLDFGISKLIANSSTVDPMRTKTGAIMGTPHYMAPEQMRGQKIDLRVDIYALGVTLYEVLSGQRPFDAASYPELVLKIVGDPVTPLDRLVPGLPRGLSNVVARAMARDQADRFPSVHALLTALAPYRGGQPSYTESRSPRPDPTQTRPHPRTPLFSESVAEAKTVSTSASVAWPWLAGAAAVLALAGAGVLWDRRAHERSHEDSVSAASASEAEPGTLNRDDAPQAQNEGNAPAAEPSPEGQSLIGAPVDTATEPLPGAEPVPFSNLIVPAVPDSAQASPAQQPVAATPKPTSPQPSAATPGPAPQKSAQPAASATQPAAAEPAAPGPTTQPPPAKPAGETADETPQKVLEDLRKLTPDDFSLHQDRSRPRMNTSEF